MFRTVMLLCLLLAGSSTAQADVPVPGVPAPCEGKEAGDACTLYSFGVEREGICVVRGPGNSPECDSRIPPGVEPRSSGCGGCALPVGGDDAAGLAVVLLGLAVALGRR